MINETFETQEQKTRRQNERRMREAMELKQRESEELERRRQEWNNTPDEKKLCDQCGLKLDPVTVAKIGESPMMRREHSFCSSFNISPGVIGGLTKLLKEIYAGDDVPLSAMEQLVTAWKSQSGRCQISHIQLAFPVEETPTQKTAKAPDYSSSVLSKIDQWNLNRQREEEREKLKRQAELHSPVIVFDADENLTLVSKTVQRWREGLSNDEFRTLVHTLNEQLKTFHPGHVLTQTSDYRYNSAPKVVGGV